MTLGDEIREIDRAHPAHRAAVRHAVELVAVGIVTAAALPYVGATGASRARDTATRTDSDSVAAKVEKRGDLRTGEVCDVRDAARSGCLPGLRYGSTTYSALILRPGVRTERVHGIIAPLRTP